MISSLSLELFESNFSSKLNTAVLKRSKYLTPIDYVLLFQYNALYIIISPKKSTEDRANLQKVIDSAVKNNVLQKARFREIVKIIAYSYQLGFEVQQNKSEFYDCVAKGVTKKFAEFISAAQSEESLE